MLFSLSVVYSRKCETVRWAERRFGGTENHGYSWWTSQYHKSYWGLYNRWVHRKIPAYLVFKQSSQRSSEMPYVSTKREWSNSFSLGLYPLTRGGRGGEKDKIRNKNLNNNLNQNVNVTKRARFAILAVSILDNLHNIIYLIYTRENKLWEGVPVLHDNFLKSIWSSRACCCGYFCLLFPWPARPTFTWTRHVSPPSSWSMPAVKIISALIDC